MDKNEPSKLALGLALLFLGSMLVYSMYKAPVVSSVSFASEPVRFEYSAENKEEVDITEKIPSRIIIPDLTIDLEVREAKIIDGYWEVFEDSAAWGEQSGLPGEIGNQVIFAHAREGLFLPLIDLKVGNIIYVMTKDSWYSYRVENIKEVFPNQIEVVAPTDTQVLTLYTCSGYNDSKRLIITAVPVAT